MSKIKEKIEQVKKKLEQPMEVKTDIRSPFSGVLIIGRQQQNTTQEDEYCTCTHCPHCGKKIRRNWF